GDPLRLALERLDDAGMAVAEQHDHRPAARVQVALAVGVLDHASARADRHGEPAPGAGGHRVIGAGRGAHNRPRTLHWALSWPTVKATAAPRGRAPSTTRSGARTPSPAGPTRASRRGSGRRSPMPRRS